MAEYYPLLARAVAGMRSAPPEQRRVIYDRARQALLGQLGTMQPPVPRESIDRESTALDEAIARVEADIAGAATAVPPESPAPPPPRVTPPPAFKRPPPPPPLPKPGPARPGADALSRLIAERGPLPTAPVRPVTSDSEMEASAEASGRQSQLPSAPRLQVPSFSDAMADADAAATRDEPEQDADDTATTASSRDEPARPPAPRPMVRERFNPRALILMAVAALVVAGIAYAAWRLRDKPESLARSRAAMIAAQQAEQQSAKVSTRVDGPVAVATSPAPAAAPATPLSEPAAPASRETPIASAMTAPSSPPVIETPPAPDAPSVSPSGPVTSPSAASAPARPDAGSAQIAVASVGEPNAIPVAQRAAFLVDAPDDPQKIKTYVGTVVWSTDNASPVQNQPIARTVHADVDIPDAALKMSLVFQRNDEAQFPASHTLELRFALQPNNTLGMIKQINVPQMRKDDAPAGDALIGLPVTITDNYFLVGLSRGDATQHNLELMKSRNWFDIPILLASGKVAKITFEKGAPGRQDIDDVLQSWQ